jgi:biopolymer transport protein ExbB/TolQ
MALILVIVLLFPMKILSQNSPDNYLELLRTIDKLEKVLKEQNQEIESLKKSIKTSEKTYQVLIQLCQSMNIDLENLAPILEEWRRKLKLSEDQLEQAENKRIQLETEIMKLKNLSDSQESKLENLQIQIQTDSEDFKETVREEVDKEVKKYKTGMTWLYVIIGILSAIGLGGGIYTLVHEIE